MLPNNTSLAELTETAMNLLCREIGVVNTARFLNQFSSGHGDYTVDRSYLYGDKSVDEVVAEIREGRHTHGSQGAIDPASGSSPCAP